MDSAASQHYIKNGDPKPSSTATTSASPLTSHTNTTFSNPDSHAFHTPTHPYDHRRHETIWDDPHHETDGFKNFRLGEGTHPTMRDLWSDRPSTSTSHQGVGSARREFERLDSARRGREDRERMEREDLDRARERRDARDRIGEDDLSWLDRDDWERKRLDPKAGEFTPRRQ